MNLRYASLSAVHPRYQLILVAVVFLHFFALHRCIS